MTITWSTLTRHALAASLLTVLPLATSGCIEDSDCGICDPDNLVLESISGVNYASRKIHLLGPECEGDDCPGPINTGTYFIEEIGPCEETEEAKESPRGTEEFCKISPLITVFGIEFVFNNLLNPTSIEQVRKRPDNPQLFEVYDWKHRVLEIQGPITRYNGDYVKGGTGRADIVTRLVSLACIDNLAAEGSAFSNVDFGDPTDPEAWKTNPCNAIGPDGAPRKLWKDGIVKSYAGTTTSGSNSCDTPEDGVDLCCNECDFLLSTQIAKYGLTAAADALANRDDVASLMRNPNTVLAQAVEDEVMGPLAPRAPVGNEAIICDPAAETGDKFIECAAFIPWAGRSLEERTYRYGFCDPADPGCTPTEHKLPYYDQLRETHPNDRPPGLERKTAKCTNDTQCLSAEAHDLPGTECVGRLESDPATACTPGVTEGCIEGTCVAEWFVTCRQQLDTTGETGFCFDQRFSDRGAGACLKSNGSFDALCDENGENCSRAPAGNELAFCDHNEDGTITGSECCQSSLGGSSLCDPFSQDLSPVSIYGRNDTLPEPTRDCICPSDGSYNDVKDDPACGRAFQTCFGADGKLRAGRGGEYAVKFVERPGGVIYDPAIKGFEFRPADTGSVPRGEIERCAETRGLIDDRNKEDGWRANDIFLTENIEDFDRALCSGQEYTVEFNGRGEGQQFVVDKADNTLEGKSTYTFQTPQFHVTPDSGFPTDNLRIGACDPFSLRFSNKFDMSPENVRKVEIWRINEKDNTAIENFLPPTDGCPVGPVAGGANCTESGDEYKADECLAPCLTADISNVNIGEISVQVDPARFGSVLSSNNNYRVVVPGLTGGDLDNGVPRMGSLTAAAYQGAFWDVCGMPLVLGGSSEADYLYDFTVDDPKCKEDADRDTVQLSCDNAPDVYNPGQEDVDGDGVGDVVDLCPTVPGAANNSADSDRDGVGNDCDNCRQTVNQYNVAENPSPLGYMLVRNVPFQLDTDQDGIGDVCDNCVTVANCQEYGPDEPFEVGDPIDVEDETRCNQDNDSNMIGNACEGLDPAAGAAGVIGLGPDDDFDQDGLTNVVDVCPRQPVPDRIDCVDDDVCPTGAVCSVDGVCNHLDTDNDGVGDICDTCAFVANPMQIMDGQMQEDDEDGDFVGGVCETHSSCENRDDARPFAFFEIAANGNCCTVALFEDADGNLQDALTNKVLLDPEQRPVRVECTEAEQDADICVALTTQVANTPGILTPPPGCDEALAGLDPTENPRLDGADGDLAALWSKMCFLPQLDQDYDGIGDRCDLCEYAFDPRNEAFIDDNGKVWPDDGKFCNGQFSVELTCGDDEDTGTGGSGTGGTGGGSDGGTGGGSGTGG